MQKTERSNYQDARKAKREPVEIIKHGVWNSKFANICENLLFTRDLLIATIVSSVSPLANLIPIALTFIDTVVLNCSVYYNVRKLFLINIVLAKIGSANFGYTFPLQVAGGSIKRKASKMSVE